MIADVLFSLFFKIFDRIMMVGGKDIILFGIDFKIGKVLYLRKKLKSRNIN